MFMIPPVLYFLPSKHLCSRARYLGYVVMKMSRIRQTGNRITHLAVTCELFMTPKEKEREK